MRYLKADDPSKSILRSIQALRCVAACAVVVYHSLYMLGHTAGYNLLVPTFGASGVDLFFVISGFVMVYTTYESFSAPGAPTAFMRRRLIRIVPIYWFYTTLVALLLAFAPRLFATVRFEWHFVISSYFFLLSKNSAGDVGTVMQTGWTLCYEMYFYVLFALLLNFQRRYFLPVAAAVFGLGILIGQLQIAVPTWATVTGNPMLIEFFLGAVLAFLFMNGYVLSRRVAIGVALAAVATVLLTEGVDFGLWTRVFCWGVPGGMLVMAAVSLERAGFRMPRLAVSLGDSSYSLYLVHPFVIPALGKAWALARLQDQLPAAALFAIAVIASLVAGHLSFLLIERPVTRSLSRLTFAGRLRASS